MVIHNNVIRDRFEFLPEERYFFPSDGKKWVLLGRKPFFWEEMEEIEKKLPRFTESVTTIN